MDPDVVRNQRFLLVRRGYDPEAVQEFLEDVATSLEDLRAGSRDPDGPGAEVADARREVDEARTRAATHRLRAQRDVEALERTGRQRRARLLAEIEELAAARDQLSTDLDRAVDVVDRVVQWVRRTDPGAPAESGPGAVPGATPSVAPDPDTTVADVDEPGLVVTPASDPRQDDDPDTGEPADEPDPGAGDVDERDHGGRDEPDPGAEPGEGPDVGEVVDEPDPVPAGVSDVMEVDASDPVPEDVDPDPASGAGDEPDVGEGHDPDDEELDEPEPQPEVDGPGPGAEADESDAAADEGDPEREAPEDLADALPGDAAVVVGEGPGIVAVREALRAVQDQVLANLRDRPRGRVAEWLPSPTRLEALDDAATDAAGDAFLAGWQLASRWDAAEPAGAVPSSATDRVSSATGGAEWGDVTGSVAGDDGGEAREALEEVRGAGDLPGLDVAADLRVALEASLARGREADDPEVALRERVAEVHRDLRQTRLPDAIEDVLVAARHHGELARWRADGVAAVAWVVGQERRCPGRRCRGNADDGVVAPGTAFAFGDVVPPAHPGCTCTLRPVGRDEDLA